jgi:hypothetical protein
MKIRQGFVSNSSSSSFVIPLNAITADQKDKIYNHLKEGKKLKMYCCTGSYPCTTFDQWKIFEEDGNLIGATIQDNFDMDAFFGLIGLNPKEAKWDRDGYSYFDEE